MIIAVVVCLFAPGSKIQRDFFGSVFNALICCINQHKSKNINQDRHCRKRKIGNRGTLIVPFSEKNAVIYSFYNDLTVKKLIEG